MLKALYNSNFTTRVGLIVSSPAYKHKRDLFSDLSASRSAGLRIVPRSFGPGDLRVPPLITHEKTAPSRQLLPKSLTLFGVRMSKKELRL